LGPAAKAGLIRLRHVTVRTRHARMRARGVNEHMVTGSTPLTRNCRGSDFGQTQPGRIKKRQFGTRTFYLNPKNAESPVGDKLSEGRRLNSTEPGPARKNAHPRQRPFRHDVTPYELESSRT